MLLLCSTGARFGSRQNQHSEEAPGAWSVPRSLQFEHVCGEKMD